MNRTPSRFVHTLALSAWLTACAGGNGTGALRFVISGEDAAAEGFPIEEDGVSIGFADGWAPVRFTKILVSVGNLRVGASASGESRAAAPATVVDLTRGDQTLTTLEGLEAMRWDRVGFDTLAPDAAAARGEGVEAADVATMAGAGYAMWIEGTATKGDRTVGFRFGLATGVRHDDCTSGSDEKAGVIVSPSGTSTAVITLHLEHLFFDALGGENAQLRFDAMAAAAGDDGVVTMDELASQPLAGALGADGKPLTRADGTPLAYDPGATPLAESNLRAFVLASSSSMAHLDGEGLCTLSR